MQQILLCLYNTARYVKFGVFLLANMCVLLIDLQLFNVCKFVVAVWVFCICTNKLIFHYGNVTL